MGESNVFKPTLSLLTSICGMGLKMSKVRFINLILSDMDTPNQYTSLKPLLVFLGFVFRFFSLYSVGSMLNLALNDFAK